jgi:hypothetical protein
MPNADVETIAKQSNTSFFGARDGQTSVGSYEQPQVIGREIYPSS